MILSPKRLRTGARVAIVAPSGPVITEEVQAGIDIIRESGLEPVLGPCVKNLKSHAAHAGTVKERVEELNWAFSHPGISGVIGAVGGEGSAAVLPYLDYTTIRRSRKAFLGMSDLTAINAAILSKAGLVSISGQTPSIRLDKGKKITEKDSESFRVTLEPLKSDQKWLGRPFQFNSHFPRTVSPGSACGVAVGGNLDTYVHLIGTPFMPDPEGQILFVEDVHKGGEEISRELLHLRLAGFLSRYAGVVVGEFEDIPRTATPKIPPVEDVLMEYFSSGPPCSYGYSFSHGPLTSPLPIGAICNLDALTGEVTFDFSMST